MAGVSGRNNLENLFVRERMAGVSSRNNIFTDTVENNEEFAINKFYHHFDVVHCLENVFVGES